MGDELRRLFDPATITPWDVVFALLSVAAAWIASNFARRAVLAVLDRFPQLSPTPRSIAARVTKYTIILVGIGVGITFLGASVQPLLAVALIVAVVLGLALRGISDNLAAGVILQTRQPVHIGDYIQCDEYAGVVAELNARSVVMTTLDGRRIHVPNSHLLSNPLVNDSTAGGRRSEVEVRSGGSPMPIAELTALVADLVGATPGVRDEPAAGVLVVLVAADRTTLRARFWHDPTAAAPVSSAVVQALAEGLADRRLEATVTSELAPPPLVNPPAL